MMSFADEVLTEVRRLRILFLIRHKGSPEIVDPVQPSSWNEVDEQERERVLRELVEEGFVEPVDHPEDRTDQPFRLSSVGEGFLKYLQERSSRVASSGVPDPMPN